MWMALCFTIAGILYLLGLLFKNPIIKHRVMKISRVIFTGFMIMLMIVIVLFYNPFVLILGFVISFLFDYFRGNNGKKIDTKSLI